MIKIGLFILPNYSTKQIVQNLKKIVKKKFGNQTYLDHLPHCSVYVFNTTKKNLNEIKKIKYVPTSKSKAFNVEKTDVFYKDPITKKNTYFLKIKKNNFLKKLQKSFLKTFNKYSYKKKIRFSDKTMNKNYRSFGYPFTNSNWKPHFTIASISLKKDQSKFIKDFKKISISKTQTLKNIYLYQIKRNKHKFICKIKI